MRPTAPRPAWALLGVTLASACASYAPAPLSSASVLAAYETHTIDGARVSALTGREYDATTLDRRTLMAVALTNNPAIAEARAHAESAEAAARAARAGPSVTLNLTAEYARQASEQSPWLYGLASDIPLDVGARRHGRLRDADLTAIAARYDYAEQAWATRMNIRRALAERLISARELALEREIGELRSRQMGALERRLAAGAAARSEVERVRVDGSADVGRLNDVQARALVAQLDLAQALGVPLHVVDRMGLVWDDFEAPSAIDEGRIAQQQREALLARADILTAIAAYDQADAALRAEIARQYPEIHVGPGYTWERGLVKLPFTLGIVLPPLDLQHNGVRAAEAHRREAGAHIEAVVARALGEIDTARAQELTAYQALARLRASDLVASTHAAEQADLEIASGAIDRVDWAAAQIGLRLTQLGELAALRRVHEAEAALENALRRPMDGPELESLLAFSPEAHS